MRIFLIIFLTFFALPIYATSNQYIIIIDAGSSSSRAHVFEYVSAMPMVPVPVIKDIFSQSTKPALASFVNNPQNAGASLQSILTASAVFLKSQGVNLSQVPVRLLATAGMRLLTPAQQRAIYQNVRAYIHSNYSFSLNDQDVQTITGVMEGIYDWLDVNYLSNNFLYPPVTVGTIDMGGASTQIAFVTSDTSKPQNEIAITLNNTRYNVFSQSFLGLGQDQALAAIQSNPATAGCYPQGYVYSQGTGNFNFSTCSAVYFSLIQSFQVAQNILPLNGQNFIAFASIYFNYSFFDILATPTQTALDTQIHAVCYQTWAHLQTEYNNPFLSTYCANGVYFDALLYGTYQLQDSQLTVVNAINGNSIDWTLGSLLYSLVKS